MRVKACPQCRTVRDMDEETCACGFSKTDQKRALVASSTDKFEVVPSGSIDLDSVLSLCWSIYWRLAIALTVERFASHLLGISDGSLSSALSSEISAAGIAHEVFATLMFGWILHRFILRYPQRFGGAIFREGQIIEPDNVRVADVIYVGCLWSVIGVLLQVPARLIVAADLSEPFESLTDLLMPFVALACNFGSFAVLVTQQVRIAGRKLVMIRGIRG